jgi:hypothetical protein
MRCIFCKSRSKTSRSREHIVPESLGNKDYVLPRGWVCDKCNNYLARKVEAPFLDSVYGRNSRFEMQVENKKGVIPTTLRTSISGGMSKSPCLGYTTSRFIAKIGYEILAYTTLNVPGSNDEIVLNAGLDEIRNYVREGRPGFVWPLHTRRLYPADHIFRDETGLFYESLHEWKMLGIPTSRDGYLEFYAVMVIFGIEYVINLGGSVLDGYEKWLTDNSQRSHLYPASEYFRVTKVTGLPLWF